MKSQPCTPPCGRSCVLCNDIMTLVTCNGSVLYKECIKMFSGSENVHFFSFDCTPHPPTITVDVVRTSAGTPLCQHGTAGELGRTPCWAATRAPRDVAAERCRETPSNRQRDALLTCCETPSSAATTAPPAPSLDVA
jgi:hypothetical protein